MHLAFGAVIGAVINGVTKVLSNMANQKSLTDGLGTAIIAGAASGVLAASGVGTAGLIVGNALISMAENAADQVIANKGFNNFDAVDMMIDGVISGISASSSTADTSANHLMSLGKQSINRPLKELKQNGVKAGISGAKKAASYYIKNTSKYYKGIYNDLIDPKNISKDIVEMVAGFDVMKNLYRQIPRYIISLSK